MALPVRIVTSPAVLAGQENGKLPTSILVQTPGLAGGPLVRLVSPAARAWQALTAAASAAGHTLKATSAADSYRAYEIQRRIFLERYTLEFLPDRPWKLWDSNNNGVKERWYQLPNTAIAAVPGTSNHGWGLAVDTGEERDGDLGTESIDATTLNWLVANEQAFGYSHEVQSEPWHIRYWAGDEIPAAVLAYEEGQEDMTPDQAAKLQAIYSAIFKGGSSCGFDAAPNNGLPASSSIIQKADALLERSAAGVDPDALAKAVKEAVNAALADPEVLAGISRAVNDDHAVRMASKVI